MSTINHRKAFQFPLAVAYGKFPATPVHNNLLLFRIFSHFQINKFNRTTYPGSNVRLLHPPTGRTTDVEGSHGQLGAGFTDGLGG